MKYRQLQTLLSSIIYFFQGFVKAVSQINDKEKQRTILFPEDSFEFARAPKPRESAKDARARKAREDAQRAQAKKQEEQDRKQAERDEAQAEQARIQAERDKAQAEQNRIQAERDKAQAEQDRIQTERDKAQAEQARIQAERDKAQAEQNRIQAERDEAARIKAEEAVKAEARIREAETRQREEDAATEEDAPVQERPRRTSARGKKKNSRRAFSILLNVAIVALSLLILYQLYMMAKYYLELRANEKVSQLAVSVMQNALHEQAASPSPVVITPAPSADSDDAPAQTEDVAAPPQLLSVIEALRRELQNDDIVGYITIEGTNINYPVVQTTNNDFYVSHNLSKEKNASGAVFMSYINSPTMTSRNTILYAHNMKNGSMFHDLRYYSDRQFFNEHRTIHYISLYEESVWEIFAIYPTSTSVNYTQTDFTTLAEFDAFLQDLQLRSVVKSNVEVSQSDTLLTLSTCTNTAEDMRYALHAKRVYPQP